MSESRTSAERALVGSILMTPVQRHTVHIDAEELQDPLCRRTLQAIDAIWAEGREPNPVLIEEWTESNPGKIVRDDHQHQLRERACMIWQIGEMVRIIREDEIDRRVRVEAQRILGERKHGDKLLADAQTAFNTIGAQQNKSASVRLIKSVMEYLSDLERRGDGGGGILTGWDVLDSYKLLDHGGVMTVAGRPSMGKSALVQALSVRWATHGEKVLVLSTETPMKKAAARYLSAAASINSSDLEKAGGATMSTWVAIQTGARQLADLPIWIDDQSDRAKTICRSIRQARQQHGVSVVILDHLQECLDGEDDLKEIGQLLSQVRSVCREAPKTALVIVSQLNRRVEHRETKKPNMSDLRASGRIEEISDSVVLVYRPFYYRETKGFEDSNPGELFAYVAKNRDGPTGAILLSWDDKNGRVLGPMSRRIDSD